MSLVRNHCQLFFWLYSYHQWTNTQQPGAYNYHWGVVAQTTEHSLLTKKTQVWLFQDVVAQECLVDLPLTGNIPASAASWTMTSSMSTDSWAAMPSNESVPYCWEKATHSPYIHSSVTGDYDTHLERTCIYVYSTCIDSPLTSFPSALATIKLSYLVQGILTSKVLINKCWLGW